MDETGNGMENLATLCFFRDFVILPAWKYDSSDIRPTLKPR